MGGAATTYCMLQPLDRERLQAALAQAEHAVGVSDPNPRVGCVIGLADGTVLGAGHTQEAGGPHAEVMALRAAAASLNDVRGATAWVTLEPCAHHGRTPPCCDALIAAGLRRVIVAGQDPNPLVAGEGLRRMTAAGLQVQVLDPADPLAVAATRLNVGFFHRMRTGRPWIRLKSAISLDGRTALPTGESQWITGEAARRDGHAWRRRAGAVLTGVGTILADDPRLDVRLVPTSRQPLRVVVDSQWRLPSTAQILQPPGRVLQVGAGAPMPDMPPVRGDGGWERWRSPGDDSGRVDLRALAQHLGALGINELHVEAGPVLSGSWLQAGAVDELLVYIAPVLLGPGLPLALTPELTSLASVQRWRTIDVCRLADDVRLVLVHASAEAPGFGVSA